QRSGGQGTLKTSVADNPRIVGLKSPVSFSLEAGRDVECGFTLALVVDVGVGTDKIGCTNGNRQHAVAVDTAIPRDFHQIVTHPSGAARGQFQPQPLVDPPSNACTAPIGFHF